MTGRRSLAAPALALATIAGVPSYVLGMYLPAFNTRHVVLEGVAPERSALEPTPALARRLALVVTDGISFDVFRGLDELVPLRHEGVLRGITVAFPSYTSPAITSLLTGVPPRESGVRLNGDLDGLLELDSVTASAEQAGSAIIVYPRQWKPFEALSRADHPAIVRGKLAFAATTWMRRLTGLPALALPEGDAPAREIVLIYLGEADAAAHEDGAASRQYAEATHRVAALVSRYVETLDLRKDTVFVASDHGHRSDGGHGGVEPEIRRAVMFAAGPFVRRGVELGDRPMRDIASTLALVAGTRVPGHNLGRPMLDALDLDDEQHAYALAAPFDQAIRALCKIEPSPRCAEAPPLLARLLKADGGAAPGAEALLDAIWREHDGAVERAASERGAIRFGAVALVVAALAFVAWRGARGAASLRLRLRGLGVVVASAGGYAATLALIGYRVSFSRMSARDVFLKSAALAGAVEIAIAVALGRRVAGARAWLLGMIAPFALLAAWVGADPTNVVSPHLGVLVFLSAPAVVAAAIAALFIYPRTSGRVAKSPSTRIATRR